MLDWQRTIAAHRPATRRAYLSTVRTFCRWAVSEGLLPADPTRGLAVREPRSVPRALSAAEMGRLRAVLPDLRARLVVALMAREGLRCAEVSGLGVADWDRAAGSLRVHGKGGHVRVLPLAADVEMLLAGWVGERRSGPLVGLKAATLSRSWPAGWPTPGSRAAATTGSRPTPCATPRPATSTTAPGTCAPRSGSSATPTSAPPTATCATPTTRPYGPG